jgi:agmatine deiminase
MPAEWEPHGATWVAWPSHADLWQENLQPARAAFAKLVAAIAGVAGGRGTGGETAEVLVPDAEQESLARAALPKAGVRFHRVPFGDIWLRDTAPVFLVDSSTRSEHRGRAARFRFNGWGGKYVLDHDDAVAARIAAITGWEDASYPFVLEGGAVEVDGEGTLLTTRQCLLNTNRNGVTDERTVERLLRDAVGVEAVRWLDRGLENDHTDGHVDTLVRFVRPGVVVAMEARSSDDPNAAVLASLVRDASALVDARGRRIEVVRLPSPGRVTDAEGRVMPASYVNFYVCNAAVVVPTYGSPFDAEAVERVGALFPGRKTIGVDARAILSGGGAFHCITQQQPRVEP